MQISQHWYKDNWPSVHDEIQANDLLWGLFSERMLRVKEVLISLIVIVLVSIHSRIFVVKTKNNQYLVKLKHPFRKSVPSFYSQDYSTFHNSISGNDYFDYVDYSDYSNGVQGGDYLDDLYVDENWDPNHVNNLLIESEC